MVLLAFAIAAPAADVSSIGNWTETVDASDLIAGAGSNVTSQYESVSGSTILAIVNTAGGSWRVLARCSADVWHDNLTLSLRRTSDGSGSGTILGGSGYVQLSSLDTEIFSGIGDRSSVAVQFRLTGMSKDIFPNTYNSGITFIIVQ